MKALALFSGGLDSMLAVKLIVSQGIEVLALNMDIGFGGKDDKSEIMRRRAAAAGADFKSVDIRSEYLRQVLFEPKYGYGKHFNPCIDCHGYMFKTALAMLQSEGASFIITGEVLGQRPMSQRAQALAQVGGLSGDEEGLILRPLCAKLLPPTTPEIKGWVDRDALLDISGRGRARQMQLAAEFGFEDYETPAGGCLLTVQSFSERIKDAVKFEKIETPADAEILKFGRHLRLPEGAKLIIGRDESDNKKLAAVQNPKFSEIKFKDDVLGALSLLSRGASEADRELAARLALTYAKTDAARSYALLIEGSELSASPFESKDAAREYFV
ncbi:argininosuccinate synthase domain-containing protein, partial [uncultured Campylobacter sp.]|uniref:argininosuccinate synthase domain-containing protein n=1 Tax=uncultured Campylobacter sp. TaxID=218934 RepID=UPI002632B9BA